MAITWEPDPFQVTDDEIQEFINAVGEASQLPPAGRVYLLVRDEIALSFDGDWFPFVGSTAGFNGLGVRRPVHDEVRVINRLRKHLQRFAKRNSLRSGGRFFFDWQGVSHRADGRMHRVVLWDRT